MDQLTVRTLPNRIGLASEKPLQPGIARFRCGIVGNLGQPPNPSRQHKVGVHFYLLSVSAHAVSVFLTERYVVGGRRHANREARVRRCHIHETSADGSTDKWPCLAVQRRIQSLDAQDFETPPEALRSTSDANDVNRTSRRPPSRDYRELTPGEEVFHRNNHAIARLIGRTTATAWSWSVQGYQHRG